MSNKPTFLVDASSLKRSACPMAFYNTVVSGLRFRNERNYKAAYGTAGHKYLQEIYRGRSHDEALMMATEYYMDYADEVPEDDFRTMGHLTKTLLCYRKRYEEQDAANLEICRDAQGQPLVESKFCWPYYSGEHFDVAFAGTRDLKCKYSGGYITLVDHKFTAAPSPERFLAGYEYDIQMKFYSLMDWIISGREGSPLPVQINGIFIKKTTLKAKEAKIFDGARFERSQPFFFKEEILEEFWGWVKAKTDRLIQDIEGNKPWEMDFAFCKQGFFDCAYMKICHSPASVRSQARSTFFTESHYNPLQFQD